MNAMSRFQAVLLCCLFTAGLVRMAEAQSGSASVNYFQYQTVLVDKMLADEYFMSDKPDSAKIYYERAGEELKDLVLDGTNVPVEFANLLKKEVEFRLMLISNHLDFWGSEFGAVPYNPIIAFNETKLLLKDFEDVYREIEILYERIDDDRDIIDQATLRSEWNRYHKGAHEINERRLKLIEDFEDKVISEAEVQISYYIERQKQLDQESKSNISEIDLTQDKLNKSLTQAVMQSAGVPPSLAQLDPNNSLEENLLQVGKTMLSDPDSPLYTEFGDLSETLNDAYDLYLSADSIYQKIEDAKELASNVDQFIRKPTFDGFLRIGQQVYSELPPETQEEWKAVIVESKPVQLLFELSDESKELKASLVAAIREQMNDVERFEEILLDIIDAGEMEAQVLLKGVLAEIASINLNADARKDVLNIIVRNWPKAFIRKGNSDFVDKLKQELGVPTEDELKARLMQAGIRNIPSLRIENGTIYLSDLAEGISIQEVLKIPSTRDIERASGQVKDELKRLIRDVRGAQAEILEVVMNEFPVFDIEQQLDAFFGNNPDNKKKELFDGAIAKLPSNDRDEVLKMAACTDAGARLVAAVPENVRNPEVSEQITSAANASNGDAAMNMLVGAGLNYLAPGAGVALSLIDQFASLEVLFEKQEAINREMNQLTAKLIETENLLSRSRKKLGVAKAEAQMSVLMQRAAKSQVEGNDAIMVRKLGQLTQTRAKIGVRLSYFYYLAEELRSAYYKLDQSTRIWYGVPVLDLIRENPQNYRYAMDEDVLLYNWLDRDIEGQRVNIDSLVYHWKFLVSAISQNCTACRAGVEQLNVQESGGIQLSEILPESEWKRFEQWKASGLGDLQLRFDLSPGSEIINPDFNNVRVVDVRIGGVRKENNGQVPVSLEGFFSLIHPGIAWIYENGTPSEDLMIFKESSVISDGYKNQLPAQANNNNWPARFGDEPRNRWNVPGGTALSPFEGYALYTIWTLELKNTAQNRSLDDIWLRFAYQFGDKGDTGLKRNYQVHLITASGMTVMVPDNQLRFFSDVAQVEDYFQKFIEGNALFTEYKINKL